MLRRIPFPKIGSDKGGMGCQGELTFLWFGLPGPLKSLRIQIARGFDWKSPAVWASKNFGAFCKEVSQLQSLLGGIRIAALWRENNYTPKVFSALKTQVPQQAKNRFGVFQKPCFQGKRRKISIHQRAFKVFVGDPFAQHWCIDFGILFLRRPIAPHNGPLSPSQRSAQCHHRRIGTPPKL